MCCIDTVGNKECVFVMRLLRFIKPLRRDNHIITFLHELALELEDGFFIGACEFRVLIDTVINNRLLAKRAGHIAGCRVEGPEKRPLETQLPTHAANTPLQHISVNPTGDAASEEWNRDRRVHIQLVADFLMSSGEVAKFVGDAFQVVSRRGWLAITDRVDPEHAVVFCKPKHDMLLAERIAVPIVGKADDIPAVNHRKSWSTSLSRGFMVVSIGTTIPHPTLAVYAYDRRQSSNWNIAGGHRPPLRGQSNSAANAHSPPSTSSTNPVKALQRKTIRRLSNATAGAGSV